MEATGSHELFGMTGTAFRAMQLLIIFRYLHEALKTMLTDAAFEFVNGHVDRILYVIAIHSVMTVQNLTYRCLRVKTVFEIQKPPAGIFLRGVL